MKAELMVRPGKGRNMTKMKIGITLAVIVAVIGGAILFVYNQVESKQDTELSFAVSPKQVELTVDGEEYGTVSSGDTITVPLGETAEIEVSSEGFTPYSSEVEIAPGQHHTVTAELTPETQQAEEILEQEQQGDQQQQATEAYLEEAEQAYESYPILDDLPQHGSFYSAYQGLSEASGHDFGIHLYLYEGHEDKGRQDFESWINTEYNVDDYDIIEHVEDEELPLPIADEPRWKELEETSPEDITIPTDASAEDLTHSELAALFVETTTTWDTTEDVHHTDGIKRATSLMTEEQADAFHIPKNPNVAPAWREAANMEAKSKPWVRYYETDTSDDKTNFDMDVCWAWVTADERTIVDGPRTLELTIADTKSGPRVESFTYEDPDPFVDNSHTNCRPADAPPAD